MRFQFISLCLLLCSQLALAASDDDVEPASSEGMWGFSGGVGLGAGSFSVRATVSYFLNPYIGGEFSGSYFLGTTSETENQTYGPEVAAVMRGVNPTFVTPFAGAGLGYEIWQRKEKGELFDDASSPLGIYFAGLSFGISNNVTLSLKQTWYTYLSTPPRKFGDHEERENESHAYPSLGLVFSF